MKVFCVRQKSTGLFIPRLPSGRGRGGSHLEPSDKLEPRLFHSQISALRFLSNWLKGVYETDHFTGTDGEENYGLKVVSQPHRKKDDMEIVEFDCVNSLLTRPVAFRVGPFGGNWALYDDEESANKHAETLWDHAVSVQGLYVRDGT